MIIFRIAIVLFFVLAAYRSYKHNRLKKLSFKKLAGLEVVFLAIIIFTIYPNFSNSIARLLDVGRGADVIFFLSILFLLYITFALYIKLQKLQNQLSDLAIQTSKELHVLKKDS
jgi:hypothetical protein